MASRPGHRRSAPAGRCRPGRVTMSASRLLLELASRWRSARSRALRIHWIHASRWWGVPPPPHLDRGLCWLRDVRSRARLALTRSTRAGVRLASLRRRWSRQPSTKWRSSAIRNADRARRRPPRRGRRSSGKAPLRCVRDVHDAPPETIGAQLGQDLDQPQTPDRSPQRSRTTRSFPEITLVFSQR